MNLEEEIQETIEKLLENNRITYAQISFKVGLDGSEVDAKGNKIGMLVLETLGVSEEEYRELMDRIVKPATIEFNKEISALVSKRLDEEDIEKYV